MGSQIIDPFKFDNSMKINFENFLDKIIFEWYMLQPRTFKLKSWFIQDNDPSHFAKLTVAHLVKKKVWSIIKIDIYEKGKQCSSQEDIWKVIKISACLIKVEVENLKSRVERLMKVME